jgi:hypothetical protein
MDPNANVAEQVKLAREITEHPRTVETHSDDPGERYSLVHSAERLAELVLALDEWRGKGGFAPAAAPASVDACPEANGSPPPSPPADWLLEIHRMLFPERYPREDQPDHIYWTSQAPSEEELADGEELGVFDWSSETIEWVATMLERALANDPRAKLT